MMNNKGQSLVLFVLLLPIMLGIMALVIDGGHVFVYKNHVDNVLEMVADLAIQEDFNQNKIYQLLDYNLDDNDYHVVFNDDSIVIESSGYVDGIFSKLFDFQGFYVKSKVKKNRIKK